MNAYDLKEKESLIIKDILLEEEKKLKLLSFKVKKGALITCKCKGLFSFSSIYEVENTRFAMRKEDAKKIIGDNEKTICLVGNPNVGKSTLFNLLTNSSVHTGNWTGKTVDTSYGKSSYQNKFYTFIDLPGTYSLFGMSEEEKLTSKFVLEKNYDMVLVIVDASHIERSLTIAMEVLDITSNVLIVFQMLDIAEKNNIKINEKLLEKRLHGKVLFLKDKKDVSSLYQKIEEKKTHNITCPHTKKIEHYLSYAHSYKKEKNGILLHDFIEKKEELFKGMNFYRKYITKEEIMKSYQNMTEDILKDVVDRKEEKERKGISFLNFIFTNRFLQIPTFFLLLSLLMLLISFSSIPQDYFLSFFKQTENILFSIFSFLPKSFLNPIIYGGYRTLYWVLSVMLPPLILFVPIFSLLEEFGLFPRIAFSFDRPFSKCGSCGKQSLTMCMGLCCNAIGVHGTKIMENKKLKLLAILTNVFTPCNGRLPIILIILQMFFPSSYSYLFLSFFLFSILLTFLMTFLLNKTIIKNKKDMFLLEIPSFKKPKILKTIYTSIKEKVFEISKKSILLSFPAGIFIYLCANVTIYQHTILDYFTFFLNPIGHFIHVDGVILLSFLFGICANEIILPILLLSYSKGSMLVEYESIESLKSILLLNGWNMKTSICFLILVLCHFPCITTLFAIKKETNSNLYTIISFLLPMLVGFFLCFLI